MGKSGSIAKVVWLLGLVLAVPIGYVIFLLKYHSADLIPVIALACGLGFAMLVFAKASVIRAGRLFPARSTDDSRCGGR
jgi:hypothetical protein